MLFGGRESFPLWSSMGPEKGFRHTVDPKTTDSHPGDTESTEPLRGLSAHEACRARGVQTVIISYDA